MVQEEAVDRWAEPHDKGKIECPLQTGDGGHADAQARGPQRRRVGEGARSTSMGAVPRARRLHSRTRWVRGGPWARRVWRPALSAPTWGYARSCIDENRRRVGKVWMETWWARGWGMVVAGRIESSEKGVECWEGREGKAGT